MNLNEIISGDRILSLCDFVIIIPSTFNFHKNILNFVNYENLIFIHDFNNININDINSTLKKSNKTHINLFIYNYLIDDFIKFILEHLDKNLTFTIYLHNGDGTFGHKPAIAKAGWQVVDKSLLGADNVIAILQVNGKIKDRIEVSPNISQDELEKLATDNSQIKAALMGVQVKKVITVTPKLVNFVI